MYSDNTLTPKEAIRLCALGTLAVESMRYSALASAIRHFVSRMLGPSLDVMGTSVEMLKYEGLIEAVDGVGLEDNAEMTLTEDGRNELKALLTAGIRTGATELNKLVITLKFRFLHLLDGDDQRHQADLLVEACDGELARLDDLRQHHAEDEGYLTEWLDHDIDQLEARLDWLKGFREGL